jgi:hypothetical protein
MPRKEPFPPEADTEPDLRKPPRQSGPAPRGKRDKSRVTTAPPPKAKKSSKDPHPSIQSRRATRRASGATVDEVVADLSKDPRRERDD